MASANTGLANGFQSAGSCSTPLQTMKSGSSPGPASWSFRCMAIA